MVRSRYRPLDDRDWWPWAIVAIVSFCAAVMLSGAYAG